jgi:hypothetical protein
VGKATTPKRRRPSSAGARARKATAKKGPQKAGKGKRRKPPGGKPTSDAELLFRLRIVEKALIDGKRGG